MPRHDAPPQSALDHGADPGDESPVPPTAPWETPPPRTPVLRWRAAVTAVLIVLVAGGAWWAVAWLTSPAPPSIEAATPTAGAALPAAGETVGATRPGHRTTPSGGPDDAAPTGGPTAASASAAPDGELRVHVVGEVARPGVVTLRGGARVADAVAAAGGATDAARPDRVNLAAPLTDGQQVLVPSASTPDESLASRAAPADGTPAPARGTGSTATGGGGQGASGAGGGTVDLNTADAAVLETLPGVGPATAQRIIDHREKVGPYTGLQDLDAVSGIGPATLERLRGHVSW